MQKSHADMHVINIYSEVDKNMRKNNTIKDYDRVYVDLPDSMNFIAKLVACPLKTIYINRNADPYANINRVFRSVDDLERFCYTHRIILW